jgi:hypothetical protein
MTCPAADDVYRLLADDSPAVRHAAAELVEASLTDMGKARLAKVGSARWPLGTCLHVRPGYRLSLACRPAALAHAAHHQRAADSLHTSLPTSVHAAVQLLSSSHSQSSTVIRWQTQGVHSQQASSQWHCCVPLLCPSAVSLCCVPLRPLTAVPPASTPAGRR